MLTHMPAEAGNEKRGPVLRREEDAGAVVERAYLAHESDKDPYQEFKALMPTACNEYVRAIRESPGLFADAEQSQRAFETGEMDQQAFEVAVDIIAKSAAEMEEITSDPTESPHEPLDLDVMRGYAAAELRAMLDRRKLDIARRTVGSTEFYRSLRHVAGDIQEGARDRTVGDRGFREIQRGIARFVAAIPDTLASTQREDEELEGRQRLYLDNAYRTSSVPLLLRKIGERDFLKGPYQEAYDVLREHGLNPYVGVEFIPMTQGSVWPFGSQEFYLSYRGPDAAAS